MQALWFDIPEEILEERRRLGHDKKDELWDGVLHMVPPPAMLHQRVPPRLFEALRMVAKRLELKIYFDSTGIYGPGDNWRIPDLSFAKVDHISERGLETAELVVEVLSPNDESRKKLPFYASIGVREVWLVDPTTWVVEIFALVEDSYVVSAGTSFALGVRLETVDGRLRVIDGDSVIDV